MHKDDSTRRQRERRDKAERIWSTGNSADDASIRAQIDARYAALHAFGRAIACYLDRRGGER